MRHLQTFRYIETIMRTGSIRSASEQLNITASALNRRIQRFEEEFGYAIFERLPRGVRLNPAGELLIQHYREQQSDFDRVRSQVSDLSGQRRGHVAVACSQAVVPFFLTEQIAAYRREHPGVTFGVNVRDRAAAEHDLATYESDIALVIDPVHMADFEVLVAVRQPVHAIMRRDHPLAGDGELRLRKCLDYPHVLPGPAYAVRAMIEAALAGGSRSPRPIVTSDSFDFMRHYVEHEDAIAFQIPIGLRFPGNGALTSRPVSVRDVPPGALMLGHLRGRTLPVAPAKFAQKLAQTLLAREEEEARPVHGMHRISE